MELVTTERLRNISEQSSNVLIEKASAGKRRG
jgi:hypothetical protein